MKGFHCLLYISLFVFANFAKAQSFSFESKGYVFRGLISKNEVEIDWKKSGFSKRHKGKISKCFKNSIDKELKNLRRELIGQRTGGVRGKSVEIVWDKEKVAKKMYPKDVDALDKRFSFFFNLAKAANGKCR